MVSIICFEELLKTNKIKFHPLLKNNQIYDLDIYILASQVTDLDRNREPFPPLM